MQQRIHCEHSYMGEAVHTLRSEAEHDRPRVPAKGAPDFDLSSFELPKGRWQSDSVETAMTCGNFNPGLAQCEIVHTRRLSIVQNSRFRPMIHRSSNVPTSPDIEQCIFCKTGRISRKDQEIAFKQRTAKGYVFCRVRIPMDHCDQCGLKSWDCDAEAIIDDAVRREYGKIP